MFPSKSYKNLRTDMFYTLNAEEVTNSKNNMMGIYVCRCKEIMEAFSSYVRIKC